MPNSFCTTCMGYHAYGVCPLAGKCLWCKERPATLHFGDALLITHGGGKNCCALCCAEMQLAHAREMAADIPAREAAVEAARLAAGSGEGDTA